MRCKHCDVGFVLGKCRDCGLMIQDQCADCHNEIAHGKVKQRADYGTTKTQSRSRHHRAHPVQSIGEFIRKSLKS